MTTLSGNKVEAVTNLTGTSFDILNDGASLSLVKLFKVGCGVFVLEMLVMLISFLKMTVSIGLMIPMQNQIK